MHENMVHPNEKAFYTISLIISIIIYLMLVVSIVGILYILLGLVIFLIMHGLSMAYIRSNGVKLTAQQFPQIYQTATKVARDMKIEQLPDFFIVQSGGILNAFATRFLGRNFVVLYSDIVELIKDDHEEELMFVIAHELAHIERRHITKQLLIFPAQWVPFLGNAYSRACEYTCDKMASAYINNSAAAVRALMVLAIGRTLFKDVNVEDYLFEAKKETGFFIWLSEMLSTHPPLPKRIQEIEDINIVPELFKTHGVQSNL